MSVEVKENAELLISIPITGRMKNVYVDATVLRAVCSCPQPRIRIKGWRAPGTQHPQGSRIECCDGGVAMGSVGAGGRRGAEIFPRKPRPDHQLKNAVVLSGDTGILQDH